MNCWSHRPRSSRTSHSIDKPLFIRWWPGLFVFTIWSATELKKIYLWEGSHLDPPNIYTMVTPKCSSEISVSSAILHKMYTICFCMSKPLKQSKNLAASICVGSIHSACNPSDRCQSQSCLNRYTYVECWKRMHAVLIYITRLIKSTKALPVSWDILSGVTSGKSN